MKLQVSFDMTDLDKALEIASQVAPHVSLLEVGSLLLYKHGTKALEAFKQAFPEHDLLADAKIIDKGKETVTLLAQAGADWITVMAGTKKEVIHSACTTAHNLGKKAMIDLLDSCSLGQSALEAQSLGGDALLFHTAYESEERHVFIDKWDMVRGNTTLPIFVSCKNTKEVTDQINEINPDGIVLGKSIIEAEDPKKEILYFEEKFSEEPETNEDDKKD